MIKHLMLMVSVTGLWLAPAAFAQKPAKAGGGDGRITPEEMMTKYDTDKDGKISKDEFLAPIKREQKKTKMTERFKTMDVNADGFLTIEELRAASSPGKAKGGKQTEKADEKKADA